MIDSIITVTCKLLAFQFLLASLALSQEFDFFYFVQQWPGAYCDMTRGCCYPTTGKPETDFGIHGLWPNFNNGSYPSSCDRNSPFDLQKVSSLLGRMEKEWPTFSCPSNDGIKFWTHEWEKHGTCAKSVLDQRSYFQTTLDLKRRVNLLQALVSAGIEPNGETYSVTSIKNAIKEAIGYTPYIQCNKDASGHPQLYQIYLCVDHSASNLIECPVFPRGKCNSEIEFAEF